jgi:catechol 2,3-dioxygenase-like lactoylglutathione lyase family enzyme
MKMKNVRKGRCEHFTQLLALIVQKMVARMACLSLVSALVGTGACAGRHTTAPAVAGAAVADIVAIDHVSFVVSRLGDARRFYVDLLGLEETTAPHPAHDGRARAAFLVGSAQRIEIEEGVAASDGRLSHLAFAVRGTATPRRLTDPDGHLLEVGTWLGSSSGTAAAPGPAGGRAAESGAAAWRIAHVGLLAGSLGASLGFYQGQLGFREFWRGGSTPARLDWVNVRVPGGNDYVELMLYEQLPPPQERGGKNHVCVFVPDVAAAIAALEARPGRKHYPRPIEMKVGRNRKRQVNLFDPDGTRVELMEPQTVDGLPAPPSAAPPPRP